MRTLFLSFILTLIFGSVMQIEAQTSQKLTLGVGRQKTVTKDKLKIQFVSLVEDSRCPTDANCVWAGNAKIKVKVSNRRGSEIFEINTNTGARGAAFNGYAINLTSLTPAPQSNIRISKNGYTATFEIRRLTR
jgi:hypothetical protein